MAITLTLFQADIEQKTNGYAFVDVTIVVHLGEVPEASFLAVRALPAGLLLIAAIFQRMFFLPGQPQQLVS